MVVVRKWLCRRVATLKKGITPFNSFRSVFLCIFYTILRKPPVKNDNLPSPAFFQEHSPYLAINIYSGILGLGIEGGYSICGGGGWGCMVDAW
jgi:hypothetical protein